jgi:hypothetical protein
VITFLLPVDTQHVVDLHIAPEAVNTLPIICLHEVGHALVASHFGARVHGIAMAKWPDGLTAMAIHETAPTMSVADRCTILAAGAAAEVVVSGNFGQAGARLDRQNVSECDINAHFEGFVERASSILSQCKPRLEFLTNLLKDRLINSNGALLMKELPIGGMGAFILDEDEFINLSNNDEHHHADVVRSPAGLIIMRPEKLLNFHTILYEIDMLRFTNDRLTTLARETQRNFAHGEVWAHLESFLLHYRSLLEFFGSAKPRPDDLTILRPKEIWAKEANLQSRCPDQSTLTHLHRKGAELQEKYEGRTAQGTISKFLQHCTTARTDFKQWPIHEMMNDIEELIGVLERHLPEFKPATGQA